LKRGGREILCEVEQERGGEIEREKQTDKPTEHGNRQKDRETNTKRDREIVTEAHTCREFGASLLGGDKKLIKVALPRDRLRPEDVGRERKRERERERGRERRERETYTHTHTPAVNSVPASSAVERNSSRLPCSVTDCVQRLWSVPSFRSDVCS
jgi:hypothetical protein